MKTLKQLCKPRKSVFDSARRDVVLDLTNLVEDNIDANTFFEENYLTNGMKNLLREAFRRFSGESPQGIYVLTQAMGGGKTHNMVALGLLAKHPELRKRVMGNLYQAGDLDAVDVVAFSGRESDAPFGIWGLLRSSLIRKKSLKTIIHLLRLQDKQLGFVFYKVNHYSFSLMSYLLILKTHDHRQ